MAPVRLCACAALAAITLTACGGTSASPAAPTVARPTSVPPSTRADAPGEISSKALARVYRATVRAGSYRLAVRTSQPTAAGIVTGTLTGRSTTATPRASVMSAVIRGATTLRLHVLQLGRDVYVRSPALRQVLPGAGSWGHVHSHGHTEPGTGIALPDIVYLTGAAGVVRILGTDTLRGTRTTHYRAEISFPKLLHNLPPKQPGLAEDIHALAVASGSGELPMDFWVDGQGRLRAEQYSSISLEGLGEDTMRIELWDFGVPVHVSPPPADQTTELRGRQLTHL